MEEDEDVLITDSEFHNHLKNAGFLDVETTPTHRAYHPKQQSKKKAEPIDSGIIEEMLVLRAANLLFEDDLDDVDNIFARFEPNKQEPLKNMFRGSIAAIVVAVGLGFYVFIGGMAFILVSIFYAYRTTDFLWRKHRRLKNLKRLMSVAQSNFSLVNRLIKFLYESENLVKSKVRPCQRAEAFLETLTLDYVDIQTKINNILADATTKLLETVNLVDYVDNSDTYVCQLMDELRNCENVSQLYNLYMLLQSQFLTRLIFSLVPNLQTDQKQSTKNLEKIIATVSVHLEKLEITLNSKLQLALMNGVSEERNGAFKPMPKIRRRAKFTQEVLLKNVHDLSNSLQYCLLKARELESNLEKNNNPDPESDLIAIEAELGSCRTHISDILIMDRKIRAKAAGPELPAETDSELSDNDDVLRTELGFPDLDPKIDDDIFEAFINGNENMDNGNENGWDGDEIDPLAKKKQREVLGELKVRLKPQADDWARRENMVFARKGVLLPLEDSSPEDSRPETSLGEAMLASGLNVADLKELIQQGSKMTCDDEQTFGDSGSEDDFTGMDPSVIAGFFLRNIGTQMEEQNFCYSGDESD